MAKKEKEHWFVEAINKGCFETGKALSKGRRWISGPESIDEPEEEKKEAAGMLDTLTEKAENIVESVKKSFLGIGESFKSGYADSPRPLKQASGSEKKPAKKSRASRPAVRVSRTKVQESLSESSAKLRRGSEGDRLSTDNAEEVSNETAEDPGRTSREDEALEREIEKVTENLPDIGDTHEKSL